MTIYIDKNGNVVRKIADKPSNSIRVTDWITETYGGEKVEGYLMNRILYNNLSQVPKWIKTDSTLIGIVSGTNTTRTGKSTIAMQVAYLLSWLLGGGKMDDDGKVIKKPDHAPFVDLYFEMEPLKEAINKDGPPNRVFILDEASEMGGSKTQLAKKNREFNDFIIRAAMKNYVLILCLPDFFSLSNNWACAHSQFLINVYRRGVQRGKFAFWGQRKEVLYYKGKKLYGSHSRYTCVPPDFIGDFSKVFPGMSPEEYHKKKVESLDRLTAKKKPVYEPTNIKTDLMIKQMYDENDMTRAEIAAKLTSMGIPTTEVKVKHSLQNARKYLKQYGPPAKDTVKDIQDVEDVQEVENE